MAPSTTADAAILLPDGKPSLIRSIQKEKTMEELPNFLWHGTTEEAARSIFNNGFLHSKKVPTDLFDREHYNPVYLTSSRYVATWFARYKALERNSDPILIGVPKEALEPSCIRPDYLMALGGYGNTGFLDSKDFSQAKLSKAKDILSKTKWQKIHAKTYTIGYCQPIPSERLRLDISLRGLPHPKKADLIIEEENGYPAPEYLVPEKPCFEPRHLST